MICKLCNQAFLIDEHFSSLFTFKNICPQCDNIYKPVINFEVVPIYQGEIRYYYLYNDLKLSFYQSRYLSRNLGLIYKFLIKEKLLNYSIVFIDLELLETIEDWGIHIIGFGRIVFFSLERYDLSWIKIFQ
jgi:hypothetical protein